MAFNSMPLFMEPSSQVASGDDDSTESGDDETDYSVSLSGLPDEDCDAEPDSFSKAIEDSVSFSFSIENPFDTESSTFGFAESSALVTCAHAGPFETPSACHTIMTPHDEDKESALISASWRSELSLRHYSRHAESRHSFSFVPDMEHETEHLEWYVMHVESSRIERDSGSCDGGKHVDAQADGKHDEEDDHNDDDKHGYRGNYQNELDDQNALCKHGNAVKNGGIKTAGAPTTHRSQALCVLPTNRMQESSNSEAFSPRGNSFIQGMGPPAHVSLCMPTTRRRTSGIFARRVQDAGDTLSLVLHAQKHSAASYEAACLPPPTSRGSPYGSNYRTSSTGSTQSSGYSSSSGKSSTPPSRILSRNESLINARCSVRQTRAGETHTQGHPNAQMYRKGDPRSPLHRKGDPSSHLQRKEDPNDQLHRKGHPKGHICEEGDSCKYSMYAQAQSWAKTDPFAIGQYGLMPQSSPSRSPTRSLAPRSPVSWRSVLSLQPLNPSHLPLDEWQILGKPSSRSHSQRSRSSSRGSSRRSSAMSPDLLGHSNSKQKSSRQKDSKPESQKMIKSRRRNWALNPMQWFRQCRKEKQVVDTSNFYSVDQSRRNYSLCK